MDGLFNLLKPAPFKSVKDGDPEALLQDFEEYVEVMEKFFRPLAQVHWENLEVNKYWEEMAAAGLSQNSDL